MSFADEAEHALASGSVDVTRVQSKIVSLQFMCAQSSERADHWMSTSSSRWDNLDGLVELIEAVFMAWFELWDIFSHGGDHAGVASGIAHTLHGTLTQHSSFLVGQDQKKVQCWRSYA